MITPDSPYFAQVQLLVRTLPLVAAEKCFALKGGTAINLFVRDMPRLSVDIDLAYLPINDRETALREVDAALANVRTGLEARPLGCKVQPGKPEDGRTVRLFVIQGKAQIKIEVTPVLRGTVFEPMPRVIRPAAEERFGFAEIQSLSFEDLYAGKLVAALDRQHPRDLYDAKLLLENEGISDPLFQAFLVYLISHDRPISEVLFPEAKPLDELYAKQFVGMTNDTVEQAELEAARETLVKALHARLDASAKQFLVSFKQGKPEWDLHPVAHVKDLPAVKWKLMNLGKMSTEKRAEAVARLNAALSSI